MIQMKNKPKKEEVRPLPETDWYTLRVQANREKSISDRLVRDKERGELPVGGVFYPTQKISINRDGKRMIREKILYPGYIFVETKYVGELEAWIKSTPGATSLLKDADGNPLCVSKRELDRMNQNQEESVSSSPELQTGQRVKVLDGPFSGFEADVFDINTQKQTVKIVVKIFGRANNIEVLLSEVEAISDN
jgi:transcriptional antiterminator NusG